MDGWMEDTSSQKTGIYMHSAEKFFKSNIVQQVLKIPLSDKGLRKIIINSHSGKEFGRVLLFPIAVASELMIDSTSVPVWRVILQHLYKIVCSPRGDN